MKVALLLEDAGMELRMTPESAYDRLVIRVLADVSKLPVTANVLAVPVARDVSLETEK